MAFSYTKEASKGSGRALCVPLSFCISIGCFFCGVSACKGRKNVAVSRKILVWFGRLNGSTAPLVT